ncbi:hypothetical protein SAMN05443254_101129 [Bradyrhizobium sp. OK095]|nr:hypothetical protein SAMN05443254_101129 [Bradyrhizobium sp. OK095]
MQLSRIMLRSIRATNIGFPRRQAFRSRQHRRRIARHAVDFDPPQQAAARKDEDTAWTVGWIDQEVAENTDTGRRFSMSPDLEIDAGAPAQAFPRRDLGQLELIEILPCLLVAVLEHPAGKITLGIRERAILLCTQMKVVRMMVARDGNASRQDRHGYSKSISRAQRFKVDAHSRADSTVPTSRPYEKAF